MTHTVKGFGVVNKAEVDVFLELSCFFDDPTDVGDLISGVSAFSKSSLNIWNFTVHVLLKTCLENFEHYFASVWDESHEIKRCLLPGRKVMTDLDSILKSRDITLPTKVHLVKAMVFSSSHGWMWELNYKESLVPKNWCFRTVVLKKTLESPLDCKEIQPVHPKGNQSWVFIGTTDAEAEIPILWPPDAKNWLIWKDLDAGKDWRQEEKGTTEGEMVG